jgi:hypothetical protein
VHLCAHIRCRPPSLTPQPYYFTEEHGAPALIIAGIFDRWNDPENEGRGAREYLHDRIATQSNPLLARLVQPFQSKLCNWPAWFPGRLLLRIYELASNVTVRIGKNNEAAIRFIPYLNADRLPAHFLPRPVLRRFAVTPTSNFATWFPGG